MDIPNNEDEEDDNFRGDIIRLTEKELNEDMPARMLIPNNPQAPGNIVLYDYAERKYKFSDTVEQLIIHFSLEGDLIHTSSNEYKAQEDINEVRKHKFEEFKAQAEQEEPGSGANKEGKCWGIQLSSSP